MGRGGRRGANRLQRDQPWRSPDPDRIRAGVHLVTEEPLAVPQAAGLCLQCGKQIAETASKWRRMVELPDGRVFGPYCRPCRKRFLAGLERAADKRTRYRGKYGLALSKYGLLYAHQRGVCAVCHDPRRSEGKPLVVDHDHKTELVRGLLCNRCNMAIGLLRDDPAMLASAIVYLTTKLPMDMTMDVDQGESDSAV